MSDSVPGIDNVCSVRHHVRTYLSYTRSVHRTVAPTRGDTSVRVKGRQGDGGSGKDVGWGQGYRQGCEGSGEETGPGESGVDVKVGAQKVSGRG